MFVHKNKLYKEMNMGDTITNAFGTISDTIKLDVIIGKIAGLVNLLPAPIKEIYQENRTVCLMAVACLLALLAFEGYKIFKMLLFTGSAFGFAFVGYKYLAPLLPATVKDVIPDVVDADVLLAVLCALLALFICKCANTFMIMILGGVVGYFAGSMLVYPLLLKQFDTLTFLQLGMVKHIVGGAIAAVCVLLFILFFKHAYIVGTSFGCAIGAALVAQRVLMPAADVSVQICFILVGIALGIFAVSYQYKEEEKAMEIVF